jgi:two-component system chemotaxis response regulator CheB
MMPPSQTSQPSRSGPSGSSGGPNATRPGPLRIIIVDDQATIRQAICDLLKGARDIEVVGQASDGGEGLMLVHNVNPDAILLDLEMPRLDGFTFLRLLMAKRPTPVVVVSSHSSRESVFRALELGAMEFVAKPTRISGAGDLQPIREDLLHKLRMVRSLRLETLAARTRAQRAMPSGAASTEAREQNTAGLAADALRSPPQGSESDEQFQLRLTSENTFLPARLICIGASTGGPPSILTLLQGLDPRLPATFLITQHMPEMYTQAFAERLRRATQWPVRTATTGEAIAQGEVLIASGGSSLCIAREGPFLIVQAQGSSQTPDAAQGGSAGGAISLGLGSAPGPSIDRMMISAANTMGERVIAVLLSGMSGEGVAGIQAVRAAGGRVIVESPESAIMTGMPQEAIRSGAVHEVVPLRRMAETLTRIIFSRR